MTDFLLLLFIVIAAIHFGWVMKTIFDRIRFKNYQDELSDNLTKLEKYYVENIVNLKLEKHNDMIYVYNMNDDSFVCQGKTRKEIQDLFKLKFPDKNGVIHEGSKLWKEMT